MSTNKKSNKKQETCKLITQYKMSKKEANEWLEAKEQTKKTNVNVLFYPAQHTENTKVYVQNPLSEDVIELQGVIRAKLDYDPELGFPVLELQIINPFIKHTD
jgi:hypothetical protein